MAERKNIYFYHNNPKMIEKIGLLQETAERYGFTIVDDFNQANVIASVGGDGTFLQAVRKTGFRQDCLYAGIADENVRGLYCDFHIDDIHGMIDAMTMEQ